MDKTNTWINFNTSLEKFEPKIVSDHKQTVGCNVVTYQQDKTISSFNMGTGRFGDHELENVCSLLKRRHQGGINNTPLTKHV